MNNRIEHLRSVIEPLRKEIINHKVYSSIKDIHDLKVFMEYHIYAVWDFMSLLKTLQNNLTCTSVPWYPKCSAETRYLINEIVVGEESDVDMYGKRISHFELYLDAMTQCGADTSGINIFIKELEKKLDFNTAFVESQTKEAAAEFVDFTFKIINSNKPYLQAAVFTFGREDLIPEMFLSVINEVYKNFPNEISIFKYYIERHIEVDGANHSHLALEMTSNLCEDNEQIWTEVEDAVIQSLKKRIVLWDGIYNQLEEKSAIANR
ncbi:heme oxygenase [Flavobacterium alvei]|uniref:Heme oxygenase n=1 Tax=Flavobacterium alvei TaxID=2080416 RepID=A0A2S5AFV4_9FLAO|nr:DUF3050 domain-containing protein [Flavobacterium alvei]POY41434.1 heme oxygenase [Flavobacterium alvei]